ncbi:hypothetical protein MMC07_009771 [Pseudocyphellaria aurata]|nr:hypothetical protein [Pseudocyphellaria aurata]
MPKQQQSSASHSANSLPAHESYQPRPTSASSDEDSSSDGVRKKGFTGDVQVTEPTRPLDGKSQALAELPLNLKKDISRDSCIELSGSTRQSRMERFSPILEEDYNGRSPSVEASMISPMTGLETASSVSTKTIKWSSQPQTPGADQAMTPSYPFPPMSTDSGTQPPWDATIPAMHRPFTALSPTIAPLQRRPMAQPTSRDRLASDHSMLNSRKAFSFLGNQTAGDPDLYEITLKLQSEPGLEQWWANVAQIMRDNFSASRATLAVPSDSTDVENVPWAQMATFNIANDDRISSGTTKDFQSAHSGFTDPVGHEEILSSASPNLRENATELGGLKWTDLSIKESRPKLESRHSFAGFPQRSDLLMPETRKKSNARPAASRTNSSASFRGSLSLAQESFQGTRLSSQSLQQHLATEADQASQSVDTTDTPDRGARGRVLPVLQMLEMESDPLLNSAGAVKVLERGKLVHITREYYDATQFADHGLDGQIDERRELRPSWPVPESKTSMPNLNLAEKPSRSPSFMGSRLPIRPRSQTSGSSKSTSGSANVKDEVTERLIIPPPYEDYEQIPVSPWSQSPAPSPAVQADPEFNPFFVDVPVDEEAFSDNPPTHDYASNLQIAVIGIDRASSIVHIPLVHPLVSRSKRQPRLNEVGGKRVKKQTFNQQKSSGVRGTYVQASLGSSDDDKKTPIAILSILSSTVPYPVQLSSSLKLLAPHLATSLYNARQHSNLEKQLAGISRQKYGLNQILDLRDSNQRGDLHSSEVFSPPSTESVTSASEYSGTSMHSPRGSNVGTPGWDVSGQSSYDEQSVNRSLAETTTDASDNYFGPRKRYSSRRTASGNFGPSAHSNISTAELSTAPNPTELVQGPPLRNEAPNFPSVDTRLLPTATPSKSIWKAREPSATPNDDPTSAALVSLERFERVQQETQDITSSKRDPSPSRRHTEASDSPRRQARLQASGQANERSQTQHKKLHSHGANFVATNPSLPSATAKLLPATLNDDLKSPREEDFVFRSPTSSMMRIMIDTGAVQEFIAEPRTGNICWANSRFQTYRNESAAQIRQKPWDAIHHSDFRSFHKLWTSALHTGDQISHQVRLKRFDGHYRWFHIRIVPIKDSYASIKHWHGQAMDIHDQHIAEVNAAREKEKAASESKYRSLANSNPHIIFAASVPDGMTFANTQWLSYSGQTFDDALGFGFLYHVHSDDIVKCQFPAFNGADIPPSSPRSSNLDTRTRVGGSGSSEAASAVSVSTDETMKVVPAEFTTDETPGNEPVLAPSGLLRNLAAKGVIKASRDGQGRLSITTEMRLRSKSGQYRWHLVQGSLIESVNFGQGEAQWIIACADISDQKDIEEKLKDANTTLESETTRKMQFLSTMSHEIRTPLNGIIGNLQFLLSSHLDEYQSEWTYGADAAARGMHDLINDILDVSKAEAKMLTLYYDWFHIRSIIEDVLETLVSKANEKRLELCYAVEREVPSNVKGDGGRIRQILLNLVSNAIKFTQRGEIFVQCTVKLDPNVQSQPEIEPTEITLLFSVQDTGTGFTEDDAKILFKPYSQIDNISTRHNGGTGLGLLLCKQMVELHHGEISASSAPGKGSTFTFSAQFKLPTVTDRPKIPYQNSSGNMSSNYIRGKEHVFDRGLVASPGELSLKADTLESSGSSDHSVASSLRAAHRSLRSSASSMDSRDNFATLDLTFPSKQASIDEESLRGAGSAPAGLDIFHPPIYSILIVCPQEHTRRTTEAHIKYTLPQSIPAHSATSDDVVASRRALSGENPIHFTHVVLQLNDATQVLEVMKLIFKLKAHSQTCVVVITDQSQRKAIMEKSILAEAPTFDFDQLVTSRRLHFLLRPARPQIFTKIFDPKQENALSRGHSRANAVEVANILKQAFQKFEELLGNRKIRVLAVEDNEISMKMLTHFLRKSCGLEVDQATNGEECTKLVFSHEHLYYPVIICDIEMPKKDGNQTCKEIRAWEREIKKKEKKEKERKEREIKEKENNEKENNKTENNEKENTHPLISMVALSANITAECQRKSAEAGFTQYITKPVNLRNLGNLLIDLVDPNIPHTFLRERLAME